MGGYRAFSAIRGDSDFQRVGNPDLSTFPKSFVDFVQAFKTRVHHRPARSGPDISGGFNGFNRGSTRSFRRVLRPSELPQRQRKTTNRHYRATDTDEVHL